MYIRTGLGLLKAIWYLYGKNATSMEVNITLWVGIIILLNNFLPTSSQFLLPVEPECGPGGTSELGPLGSLSFYSSLWVSKPGVANAW